MPDTDAPAARDATAAGGRAVVHVDGRPIEAIEGEPLVRALFRAGIRTLSWSVKLHRPRSILCARGRCSACHVEVDGRPGVPACRTRVRNGMSVRRQDFRPPWGALLHAVARTVPLPAGFYYRHFTRPAPLRRAFLGTLRAMAGVARVPASIPHDASGSGAPAVRGSHPAVDGPAGAATGASTPVARPGRADVVVVGAGLAGMAAALAAAEAGANVVVFDDEDRPGGRWIGALGDADLEARRDALVAALARSSVRCAAGVTVQAFHPPGILTVAPTRGGAAATVHAGGVILATGTLDAVPLFRDNERPGVMGARALRLLLERDGVVPGRVAVVWGRGAEADAACALLRAHGVALAARACPDGDDGGRATLANAFPVATRGDAWLRAVELATPRGRRRVACDLLCVAASQPDFVLARQAGMAFALEPAAGEGAPEAGGGADTRRMLPLADAAPSGRGRVRVVGEAAGHADPDDAIAHAEATGRALAGEVG